MSDPDCGLEAIKTGLDDVKKSVGDGKKKVAAAIAAKGVTTAADSTFDTLASNIGKIVTLSSGSADATAGAAQILSGYTAYAKGSKVSGTIPSQGAQTITPGTSAKYVEAGRYLSGRQTIVGDANLAAANIKKGVSIFGVAGNYGGNGGSKCFDINLETVTESSTSTYKFKETESFYVDFEPTIATLVIESQGYTNNSPSAKVKIYRSCLWLSDTGSYSTQKITANSAVPTGSVSGGIYFSMENNAIPIVLNINRSQKMVSLSHGTAYNGDKISNYNITVGFKIQNASPSLSTAAKITACKLYVS